MSAQIKKTRTARRFVQFSLRSVLLLVTLLAVALAVLRVYIDRYRVQRQAAAAIRAAGGTVRTEPDLPALIRALFGAENCQTVFSVDLPNSLKSASCMRELPQLIDLRNLTVDGALLTDKHLHSLRTLRGLRQLTLRGTTVSDEAVASLRRSLPRLNVNIESRNIKFEEDLRFKKPLNQAFRRKMLTRRINYLNGSRVRIRGFILPSFQATGINRFVLVRDRLEPSFGPGTPLDQVIVVEMKQGMSTAFMLEPVVVEGYFSIQELGDPLSGEVRAVFRMTDACVRPW